MIRLSNLLTFLALCILLQSCSPPDKPIGKDVFDNLQKYEFLKDGVGITTVIGKDSILRSGHDCNSQYVSSIKKFNRGGKRDNTIMVTGDLPCFAQMRTYPENNLSPDLVKLGDSRIRILYNSKIFWLDSLKDVTTVFQPGITIYNMKIPHIKNIVIGLTVFHAGNWGIGAKLQITNTGKKSENIGVDWIYGGIRKCGRTFDAAYFVQNDNDGVGDKMQIVGNKAIISDTSVVDKVGVTTIPEVKPVPFNNKALFAREIVLNKSEDHTFYLITAYNKDSKNLLSQLDVKDPEKLFSENEKYYAALLEEAVISTPNKLIDGGFRTALVNLDNVFTAPAWLEGIHWWDSYFTNLFQISAAISLDQQTRAKNALLFYNTSKLGPAPAMKPDLSPEEGTEDDGLDYYIYALLQYINLTGDTAFLNETWPDVMLALKRIMFVQDPDGDKLLCWKFGCNIFLYQADMLGMPGKSASPSLMTSGMMERLSIYAKMLGKEEDAAWLKNTSSEIKSAIMSVLWNKAEGCFYNHIDLQNIPHLSHYYTDHIFSTLYTSTDTFINWQSLNYLKKTLVENNPEGRPSLMTVGTLKGRLFGNDNVMPTQMAEAARALYKIGDKEQATSFLESVARAGTIFTESPGNFPERMDDLGKGEANYLFGNPIGSYIYSVVNGLFGLEITDMGQTFQWQPGFPDDWDHADLKLSYVKVAYNLIKEGNDNHAIYLAEYPAKRALKFSVFLPPCKVLKAICNGKEIDYKIRPALNRIELELQAEPSPSHKLELIYAKTTAVEFKERSVVEGSLNEIQFSQPVAEVKDPQTITDETGIEGNALKFKIGNKIGKYEFFVKLQNPDYFVPVILNIIPEFEILCDTAYYNISNSTLSICAKVLINRDRKNEFTIGSKVSSLQQTQILDPDKGDSVKFVFQNVPLPYKSTDYLNFRISDSQGKVFEITKRIVYKGFDEMTIQAIFKQRKQSTCSIDISHLFNANSYLNMFPWGRDERPFNILFAKKGETLNTRFGNFVYNPLKKTVALIELGRSESNNRKTIPTKYTDKMEIPVGAVISELDLLYFSEVESRNTGVKVGKIILTYANNDTTIVPLIVGKNMDFVRSYLAKDAFPVFVSENLDQIVSYSANKNYDICCSKHLNFLPILCDKNKLLKSIQISIDAADAQFGLIGLNYLTSD